MLKFIVCLLLSANIVLFGMNKGYWGARASESHEPQRLKEQIAAEKLRIIVSTSLSDTNAPAPAGTPEAAKVAAQALSAQPVQAPASVSDTAVAVPAPVAPAPVAEPVVADNSVAPARAPEPEPAPEAAVTSSTALGCFEVAYFSPAEAKNFESRLTALALPSKPAIRHVEEIVSYTVHVPAQEGKAGAEKKAAELRRMGIQDLYIIPGTNPNVNLRWHVSLGVFKTEKAARTYVAEVAAKGVKGVRVTPRKGASSKMAYRFRGAAAQTRTKISRLLQTFPSQKIHECE